jgi:hypothetical protein
VGNSLEVDSFYDVVVAHSSFDSPPEMVLLEFVLMAQFEHAGLQGNDFLSGEGLSDAVDELQFGRDVGDIHAVVDISFKYAYHGSKNRYYTIRNEGEFCRRDSYSPYASRLPFVTTALFTLIIH